MLSGIAICYLRTVPSTLQCGRRPEITAASSDDDNRYRELTAWVRRFPGLKRARPEPASEDASFRRYFRVQGDRSLIVMDAPPPKEDCGPFVRISKILEDIGLNSARVIEADIRNGFLLLSDLGSTTYLNAIGRRPKQVDALYQDALDALLRLQAGGAIYRTELPKYDSARLNDEITIFREWLCEDHLGLSFSAAERKAWQTLTDDLVNSAIEQPSVLVHRDYHSRNLMLIESEASGENPGILDFQDAAFGPLTYDLVSLLKDCYVKWPVEKIETWVTYFHERSPQASTLTIEQFMRDFDLMGVQRHLKAAGIFARLASRDGKEGYLKDIPRTLNYIVEVAPKYGALDFIGNHVADKLLPNLSDTGQ